MYPQVGIIPPSPNSKSSLLHYITALINKGRNNDNGKEVVPNPGNREQSKTKESRKRRWKGADTPSENTNPNKKPCIEDDHRVHLQVDDKILDETDFEQNSQPLEEPIPSKLSN